VTVRFGTDGLRGLANAELTPELVVALGRAAARVLARPGRSFLVGRDTRVSGPLLQAALSAGLAAEGVDVWDLGVLPTPAVAALSADRDVPAAVISASHNPFADNGIKLFAAGGSKLPDDVEGRLEAELDAVLGAVASAPPGGAGAAGRGPDQGSGSDDGSPAPDGSGTDDGSPDGDGSAPTGTAVGRLRADPGAASWYQGHLLAALTGRLDGIRVAVDCANGAAAGIAPAVLSQAGAEIVAVLGGEPDGFNINAGCGSTYPAGLQAAVIAHRADVGLAFDGDADRVIAVDERGGLVDGDQLIALFALDLRARGRLAGDTVAVTVMTNLGFRQAMQAHGVRVHETGVGDRYVLEALDLGGWSLGGEQSGHIIFRDVATTGDGILTGMFLLGLVLRQGRPLAELAAAAMTRLPQVLCNVRIGDRLGLEDATAVWAEVAGLEAELGGRGRVLLRPSGTEPVVRVMVEAPTEAEAQAAAARLVDVVIRCLG
jgi:phosphoglucosamine mutase